MGLDHGHLNLPLTKRGDIDRDIDRWKADERQREQLRRRDLREKRDQDMQGVKAVVAWMPDEQVLRIAASMRKRKPETARAAIIHRASHHPDRFLAMLMRTAGCCGTTPCSRLDGPCNDMAARCAKCRARGGCDCTPCEWMGEP